MVRKQSLYTNEILLSAVSKCNLHSDSRYVLTALLEVTIFTDRTNHEMIAPVFTILLVALLSIASAQPGEFVCTADLTTVKL